MRTYTPDDIVQCLIRRRWLVLVPVALGLAAAPFLARFAPEKFRSETLIMVVPQRVPDSYVKATITESIEDRLPSISEQILSRSRLERIITDMNLYADLAQEPGHGGRRAGDALGRHGESRRAARTTRTRFASPT